MKLVNQLSAFALLGAIAFSGAQSAVASTEAQIQIPLVQVNTSGFGDADNTSARLFVAAPHTGMKRGLYAVTANENGIELWRSKSKTAHEWKQLASSQLVSDSTNVAVVDVVSFKDGFYALLSSTDGFEVWKWTAGSTWSNVYEQHGNSTSASFMKKIGDTMYLGTYSSASGLAQLRSTTDGTTWDELGYSGVTSEDAEDIIGNVAMVNDMAKIDGQLIAITNDGRVLKSEDEGATFEVVYTSSLENAVFTISKRIDETVYIGGSSDAGALLLATTDGDTYTSVTEDGFGDSANTSVTQIVAKTNHVGVYMQNGSGFDMYRMTYANDNSDWTLWIDGGATSTQNTAVQDVVDYRGKRYMSTTNATEGAQVILFQRAAPRAAVTTPTQESTVAAGEITFTGTAQIGNRVDIRHNGETIGTINTDESGNWSITVNVDTTGAQYFHIYTQYEDTEGNAMGQYSKPKTILLNIE